MALAYARGADEQHVTLLPDKPAAGEVKDLFAFDGRVEAEVEVFKRFRVPECGRFGPAADQPLLSDIDFVLQDELKELIVWQIVAPRFLQADLQGLKQSPEP
jgi:hypothetical protein